MGEVMVWVAKRVLKFAVMFGASCALMWILTLAFPNVHPLVFLAGSLVVLFFFYRMIGSQDGQDRTE